MTLAQWINCLSVGYSRHTTPFVGSMQQSAADNRLLLRLQVEGTCKVELNGVTHIVGPGDLIIRRPGEYYRLVIASDISADGMGGIRSADYFLSCSGAWIEQWCRNDYPGKAHAGVSEDLQSQWRKLLYEKRKIHENNAEMLDALIKVLCISIARTIRKEGAAAAMPEMYITYKMKRYLEKHATDPLTLPAIANRFGISVSSASHLFKKAFGQSPMRYVIEIRLSLAAERILYSDMLLEDIAEITGFRSYPYFSRAFRAHYNISPSQYRFRQQQLVDAPEDSSDYDDSAFPDETTKPLQ